MNPTYDAVQDAKDLLKANGFVVLTAKSYYSAQQRHRDADVATSSAVRDRDSQRDGWTGRSSRSSASCTTG